MGGEIKTNVSDDFKALEMEMGLRQEGVYTPPHCGQASMDTGSYGHTQGSIRCSDQ